MRTVPFSSAEQNASQVEYRCRPGSERNAVGYVERLSRTPQARGRCIRYIPCAGSVVTEVPARPMFRTRRLSIDGPLGRLAPEIALSNPTTSQLPPRRRRRPSTNWATCRTPPANYVSVDFVGSSEMSGVRQLGRESARDSCRPGSGTSGIPWSSVRGVDVQLDLVPVRI